MSTPTATPRRADWVPWGRHFYYGWVNLVIAAVAMAATYPGRTHGLGMVTEPLLRDLHLDRQLYAQLNLWGTLLGAAFCLPIGRWLDRYGCRTVLLLNLLLLGGVVAWMATVSTWQWLFVALILTRGLGQSALSVVSITLVAKWFTGRRLGMAMAWYAVLGTPLHIALIQGMNLALTTYHVNWRWAWGAVGALLALVVAPLSGLFARSTPPQDATQPEAATDASAGMEGATLRQALATPAFWVFALTTSFWGLVYSGVALFNEAIFKERGLGTAVYFNALTVTAFVTLVSKFAAGWVAGFWPITRLLALCLALMGVGLFGLPLITTAWQVYLYAVVMGMSTGVVALVFFAV
jgi:MFS family permease